MTTTNDKDELARIQGAISVAINAILREHPKANVWQVFSHVLSGAIAAQKEDMRQLQKRMKSIEADCRFVDKGTWKPDVAYQRGDAVSHRGSLWLAQESGELRRPGEVESGWRLAVKRGSLR